jgi:hypothetical protein
MSRLRIWEAQTSQVPGRRSLELVSPIHARLKGLEQDIFWLELLSAADIDGISG